MRCRGELRLGLLHVGSAREQLRRQAGWRQRRIGQVEQRTCVEHIAGLAGQRAELVKHDRALARDLLGVRGIARVIEPDSYDLSNLNRDELLLRSSVGSAKADHLSHMNLGDVDIKPVPLRYEAAHRGEVGSLAPVVLVGVDHVESRWAVQEERPAWLGIGATEEYFALLSVHGGDLPCAKCVHEGGVAPDGPMPTAAFVSHWGGLALAAGFVRHRLGIDPAVGEQVTRITCLRPGTSAGLWRTRGYVREGCRTCGRPGA